MYLLGAHPQQNLSRATALPEPVEDLTDDFLNTRVRIEAETDFSMPAVSDRYCNAQFTSLCLGSLGIQHTGPQDAKLELADTSFRHGDILPRNICLTFWSTTRITRARASALLSCADYSMAAALISSLSNATEPRCCQLG